MALLCHKHVSVMWHVNKWRWNLYQDAHGCLLPILYLRGTTIVNSTNLFMFIVQFSVAMLIPNHCPRSSIKTICCCILFIKYISILFLHVVVCVALVSHPTNLAFYLQGDMCVCEPPRWYFSQFRMICFSGWLLLLACCYWLLQLFHTISRYTVSCQTTDINISIHNNTRLGDIVLHSTVWIIYWAINNTTRGNMNDTSYYRQGQWSNLLYRELVHWLVDWLIDWLVDCSSLLMSFLMIYR